MPQCSDAGPAFRCPAFLESAFNRLEMRFVKIVVRSASIVLVLLSLLPLAVEAGPVGGRNSREADRLAHSTPSMAIHAGDRPSMQRPSAGEGRVQRLSAEERQQLRRDIRDAGRQIYRPRR